MLAICLSKMFSQDKEERMNEIISTTKNRGTNHFVAKVTAGIIELTHSNECGLFLI